MAAKTLQDFWNEKSTWQSTFDRDRALWKAATDAAVEKFASSNSGYTKCQCQVPSVPVGFTSMDKPDVKCSVCGGHFA